VLTNRCQNLPLSLLACLFVSTGANAQTNAWTNTGSGAWETPQWSLGSLPGVGQEVLLTNQGWKAVAISSTTVQTHPETLTVAALVIASPQDSHNVLLLNYAGVAHPLSCTSLVLDTNSAITTLSSALTVQNSMMGGSFSIGGAFNQGDFSQVTAGVMRVGDLAPGVYNLTNGTLAVGTEYLGVNGFTPGSGILNQEGGVNKVTALHLQNGGEYDLRGGQLLGSVSVGDYQTSATFNQNGGALAISNSLDVGAGGIGAYNFSNGTITAPVLNLPASGNGTFIQTGGTNMSTSLAIGMAYRSFGSYGLSNGVLGTSSTSVADRFSQWGGAHSVSGPLAVVGTEVAQNSALYANYVLGGGILSAKSLNINVASVQQSGGTNQIAGDLSLSPSVYGSTYTLSGGVLQSSNCTVMSSYYGGFTQSNGTQTISNLLRVSGAAYQFSGFTLSGGQLTVSNISIESGAVFHHVGGSISQSGLTTLAGGTWQMKPGSQVLGRLVLSVIDATDSSLILPSSGSSLHFADSSSVNWSNQANLTIEGWNGSFAGGGQHQILFGSSVAALTPQQLSHVRFHNPAGQDPGVYPARILTSGEIIPASVVAMSQVGKNLVITWPAGLTLQTATNLAGPFLDMPSVSSPYTNQFNDPQRFFRLHQ
jgi:hypothetical protein